MQHLHNTPTPIADLAALPDSLLAPLLDAAGDALRSSAPEAVPIAARSLIGFDPRGLTRGPARRQLRRALDEDADFRRTVFETFAGRADVRALVDGWSSTQALAIASTAVERGELALLTSGLVAAAPDGADVGIGIALALDAQRAVSGAAAVQEAARSRQAEAQRRLVAARDELVRERDLLADDLRAVRRERRESRREAALVEARDQLLARVDALEGQLRDLQAQLERAEGERGRANVRAKRAEALQHEALDRLRALERTRDDLLRALEAMRPASPPSAGEAPGPPPEPRRRRGGRVQPGLPGGLVADSVEGADAMLRDSGVLLVVDGYNVTKAAGAGGSLATEREWLVRALEALHLRCGADIVVVFDGDDTPAVGHRPRRGRGVRVVFSPAAEEADSVVVATVSATTPTVPAVVASSDGWVREHAETFGAVVISAPTLLGVLRRPT